MRTAPRQARASRRRSALPRAPHCKIRRHVQGCRKILQMNGESTGHSTDCHWHWHPAGIPRIVPAMSDSKSGRAIRPVILAGGAGTRLWPLSSAAQPKHMLPLIGEDSLFERTLRRFGDNFAPPIIVANQAQEAELPAVVSSDTRI